MNPSDRTLLLSIQLALYCKSPMSFMLLKMNVLPWLIQLKTTDVLFVWVSEWHWWKDRDAEAVCVWLWILRIMCYCSKDYINKYASRERQNQEKGRMCPLLRGKVCLVFSFKLCGDFLRRRRISHILHNHNHLHATSKGPYLCTLSNHIWWQIESSLCCVTKTNTGKS